MSDKKPSQDKKTFKDIVSNAGANAKLGWKEASWLKKGLLLAAFAGAVTGTGMLVTATADVDAVTAEAEAAKIKNSLEKPAEQQKQSTKSFINYLPGNKSWPDYTTPRSSSSGDHLWAGQAIKPSASVNPVEAVWRGEIAGVEKKPVVVQSAKQPHLERIPTEVQKIGEDEKAVNLTTYENFVNGVITGQIKQPTLKGNMAVGKDSTDNSEIVTQVYSPADFQARTWGHNVQTPLTPLSSQYQVASSGDGGSSGGGSVLGSIGGIILSAVIFLAVFQGYAMWRQKRQGGSGADAFGKSKARRIDPGAAQIRFSDVAGVNAVKGRLMEMVNLMKNPTRPGNLGGKLPTGFLMSGPPGTGKTLLAKAVAGEAGVPFFSASGSEFVEMYVGTGAARIRNLFKEARELGKPCVVFIDEIDAVGGKREDGGNGGGKEHAQTLNQLLTELDGFEDRKGIIVIAATNRPEMLDPALKRSGRFNKEIVVPLPDIRARTEVIQLYFDKLCKTVGRNVIGPDVSALELAKGTPGVSPADLAGLVNEAALGAERKGREHITWADVSEARDTMWMGDPDHNKIMTQDEKERTAWHEAGHAMAAILNPKSDQPEKLTILPRGGALGMLIRVPGQDRVSLTYEQLLGDIEVGYAGREAEIMIYGIDGTSTGASQDFKQVTAVATQMIMDWGMPLNPDKDPAKWTGSQYHGREQEALFGRSEAANEEIHKQIQEILTTCQENARKKVNENKDKLEIIVKALLKYETLKGSHIKRIVEGEDIDAIMANDESGGIEIKDIDSHPRTKTLAVARGNAPKAKVTTLSM